MRIHADVPCAELCHETSCFGWQPVQSVLWLWSLAQAGDDEYSAKNHVETTAETSIMCLEIQSCMTKPGRPFQYQGIAISRSILDRHDIGTRLIKEFGSLKTEELTEPTEVSLKNSPSTTIRQQHFWDGGGRAGRKSLEGGKWIGALWLATCLLDLVGFQTSRSLGHGCDLDIPWTMSLRRPSRPKLLSQQKLLLRLARGF